jgi:hypothetical protein
LAGVFGEFTIAQGAMKVDCRKVDRSINFWGAHACSVRAMAFCHRQVCLSSAKFYACSNNFALAKSSLPQNAATSTLQACAPKSK